MEQGKYFKFVSLLSEKIDADRIITSPLQCLSFGTDASFYRLVPKIVVRVFNEEELILTVQTAYSLQLPLTFRAAGTSLSGQAISDSILVVATHGWRKYEIKDGGEKISLQPGLTGSRSNIYLKPYGRKLGPDPASINAAMIGGIAANNASGMCCGVSQNSYQTLSDIRIVFYDGTVLDTSNKESIENFRTSKPEIIKEIEVIRDEIKSNPILTERIKRKYKIKNTTGYSLNAFVDFDDAIDIIKQLMIGSEGTLAFISEICYRTVPDFNHKACALILFESVEKSCEAAILLKQNPVSAVELLDRKSIRSVENDPDAPEYFKKLPETASALLVEIQSNSEADLREKEERVVAAIASISTILPYRFTSDLKEYAFNWKARKGLLSSVGGLRKTGTTCLIEDVSFPLENLAKAAVAIETLFFDLGYTDATLFGHALDGNLHLVFSQDFNSPVEVERYAKMMDALSDIVVKRFDGSLKAEHGTGRNMAPFVEKEWGETAYKLMVRIKKLFDPDGLINPDVIISKNPKIHLENLKPLPAVNSIVDKCMECGFCEPNCVSEGLTFSPRQRIVAAREFAHLNSLGTNTKDFRRMKKEMRYFSEETCATDGLCALLCPVKINTGLFIKDLRHQSAGKTSKNFARVLGDNFDATTAFLRQTLNALDFFHSVFGSKLMGASASFLRTVSGKCLPSWNKYMPKGARKIENYNLYSERELKVVYFPSCLSRSMGTAKDYPREELQLTRKTEELLLRAGYGVIYPEGLQNLCCGMPFSSKGFKEEGEKKSRELYNVLYEASAGGTYPILFDTSPCFYTFSTAHEDEKLQFYDPVEFMLKFVVPKLSIKNPRKKVAVFPVCSLKKIGQKENLYKLAQICAEEVVLVDSACCGFAGDRGFTFPELNKYGLRHLKEQVSPTCAEGFSTSRTCEIGLSEFGEINFKSIFYLLEEVSR